MHYRFYSIILLKAEHPFDDDSSKGSLHLCGIFAAKETNLHVSHWYLGNESQS